jgi:hypothetical protein
VSVGLERCLAGLVRVSAAGGRACHILVPVVKGSGPQGRYFIYACFVLSLNVGFENIVERRVAVH